MVRERVTWIDRAKGIAAILMVLGHTWFPESIKILFYTFHMPLFFILSGYTFRFSSCKDIKTFFFKRIRSVVLYYLFFAQINVVWKVIKAALSSEFSLKNLSRDILGIIINIRGSEYGPGLWFLTAFVTGYFLFYFVFKESQKKLNVQILSAVGLIIVWMCYMHFIGIRLPWGIDVSPLIAFLLWIGYTARKYSVMLKVLGCKKTIYFLGFVFILSSIANYFMGGQVRVDIWSNSYGNFCLFLINAILGTAILCYFSNYISFSVLLFLGKNSVFVYGLHGIPNEVLMAVSSKLLNNLINNQIVLFVIGILITIVVLCWVGICITLFERISRKNMQG